MGQMRNCVWSIELRFCLVNIPEKVWIVKPRFGRTRITFHSRATFVFDTLMGLVYIIFDVNGLDPSTMPSTGPREPKLSSRANSEADTSPAKRQRTVV
jgi:hypothetical protein